MVLQQNAGRAAKLTKIFWEITKGEKNVNSTNAKHFLEACHHFCKQKDPVKWVELIISNPPGLNALELAVRSNLSQAFITSTTLPFLQNLTDRRVETLNDGRFLQQLLTAILVPSTFWSATMNAYHVGDMQAGVLEVFAWLCLQVVSSQLPELETHKREVETLMEGNSLLGALSHEVRTIAYRIQKVIRVRSQAGVVSQGASPGGRHDNDFADFRQISIYPTTDEFLSTEEPFLQRLDDAFEAPMELRAQTHLDWLFRLLREDMVGELREDLNIAMGKKKGRRTPISLGHMRFVGADVGNIGRIKPCAVQVACGSGVNFPKKLSQEKKKKFLTDTKNFLKHNSFGALCYDSGIVAFGSLVRDVDQLAKLPPVVGIQFTDAQGLQNAMMALQGPYAENLRFLVVDTATFAFEPILQRLKEVVELPLETHLINPTATASDFMQPQRLHAQLRIWRNALEDQRQVEIPSNICTKKPIRLQGAQLQSLINGLSGELAQIQGPPGTGKSFIGALLILIILRLTDHRVLILSYTNHALDQFIEDLMDIGINLEDIVRLGSKSTAATEPTRLDKQRRFHRSREEWDIVNHLKTEATMVREELEELSRKLSRKRVDATDILDFLEFSDDYASFWNAFQVPDDDGFLLVGANNKTLQSGDLYNCWARNIALNSIGNLAYSLDTTSRSVWDIPPARRQEFNARWSAQVRREQIVAFADCSKRSDDLRARIDSIFNEGKRRVLREKRVIACTTTAAAMYQSIIKTARPDVVMVEEAGEILEAHVITALSPSVKQLILIGDHKQLRPKVNNYKLTIEKGEGYDLNVSLFERLIRQGHHFTTLQEQHRSHPDISHFTRMLAYEELKDVPKTFEREPIRGLPSRVIFVHHEEPEEQMTDVGERRDPSSNGSKRNPHEAQMVLKIVRFLAQQGYKTENMVVLTPYLGQLSLLRDTLRRENDPYLNDLDSHDLLRAGLIPEAAAKVNKKPLRLSTIDNYQGEESDIVIASLTRSNTSGNIGFLYARERLVVLMSRARNGIILFGNMLTFEASKKGGPMWTEYFTALKDKNCLFDGVPVYCERHPDRKALLKKPGDFEQHCPDGGCSEPCGAQLGCGRHQCDRRCHQIEDHSKVVCKKRVDRICSRGHKTKVPCGDTGSGCKNCAREDEDDRRRIRRDLEMEKARQMKQDEYSRELQELEDEIDHQRRAMKYEAEGKEQETILQQKKDQLKNLKETKARLDQTKAKAAQDALRQAAAAKSGQRSKDSTEKINGFEAVSSNAKDEWEFMKLHDGARNDALDQLMGMIGLESIKDQFLSIKSTIDTKIRQDVSLKNERFSCSLLGNPGTGKTTVARIWAKFLTTVGAIAGSAFEETTGSKLASDGVKGCEKLLEDIKNDGGGVLFIDEAYQLSSGNSAGGKAVLDYLLAEVENLRGKVVFVLAGYSKQMESFFAHNPGFPSRFPITMKFEDYTDVELLNILQLQVHQKYNGRMKVEDGVSGLFFRIAARRVGYSRGKVGFGNARAIENAVASSLQRQANRLRRERRANRQPDDLLLTKEDIIGPEPSSAIVKSKAYQELNSLIGLGRVKQNLKVLIDTLMTNYERELEEKPLVEFSLNRVFLGSPGTGKTTVAKLFGQVLVDLGLLSNGEVIVKNPADFVGAVLGGSEAQTKGILAAAVGKVLVIDEAYGLYGGGGVSDPYKTAVVDTIVAEVQSVPGEDRCVLLLGYEEQMEQMFQNVNPGLSRRFPLSSAFVFEDFDDDALAKILDLKLKKSAFHATAEAKRVALEVLRRARNRPHFGNAGEIDILLGRAKESYQKRSSAGTAKRRGTFEAIDFDENFDRVDKSSTNIQKLFEGDIGREKVIALLEGYQERVRRFKSLDMDPEIPFNFLFRGPPGTGKTTTARKMGKVYYDMGFLSGIEVIECSATDMIGQYVGQTAPKVQQLLEKALGRVLFIDEAYRLAEGPFAKEAVDELVDSVTKPKYQGKLIIILAGYVEDINSLLSINPGMSSRFPEVIDFDVLGANDCIKLITDQLDSKRMELEKKKGKKLDLSCLRPPQPSFMVYLEKKIGLLSAQDGWANARDVKHLARSIFGSIDFSSEPFKLTEDIIRQQVDKMFKERDDRMRKTKTRAPRNLPMELLNQLSKAPAPPALNLSTATATQQHEDPDEDGLDSSEDPDDSGAEGAKIAVRDAGVSDEVWEQLEKDKAEENRKEEEYYNLLKARKTARDADREKIVRQILEEEERRKKAAEIQKRLMESGSCPMGYNWIKQQGGYRCAGGSHWMADAEVGIL
ncbi:Fc.00g074180.m01.CDS01 [Cosmosporella sp. VM-42]